MYLVSHYAGWGRGFWFNVDNGTIEAHTKAEHLQVRVHNGYVVEQITQRDGQSTTLRYGRDCKTGKSDGTVEEEYFQPGTTQAIRRGSLWKKKTGIPFCGSRGIVECYSTSSGAYGREVFTYNNGAVAYVASRCRKKLQIRRPNGKLWIVVAGQVHLNRQTIAEKLDLDTGDLGLWNVVRGNDWDVTVYDADGVKVVTRGSVKHRQKEGKWLEHSRQTYYISGVQVSRSLYEEEPSKWDGCEVLKIPNAQLRCSLLNKMGYDKLLEKVACKVIETGGDGGQLLEVNTGTSDNIRAVDKIMRLIKVVCPSTGQVYVLRVPPAIANYQQARQWTFGLREASLREGASLELVKET